MTHGMCAIVRLAVLLAALLACARAAAQPAACKEDGDCPGKEICERGKCRLPRAVEPRSDEKPEHGPRAEPRVPSEAIQPEPANCNADVECGNGTCGDGHCRWKFGAAHEPKEPKVSLGLFYLTGIGVAGALRNPVPSNAVGLELATRGVARYHLSLGYSQLNGFHGLVLAPVDWGFAIPVSKGNVDVYLEPILEPWKLELVMQGREHGSNFLTFSVSSAIDLPVVVEYRRAYFTLSPIGVEARYLTLAGRTGEGVIAPHPAVQWRLRAGVGLKL
jgi:hypothetical protein